MIIKKEIVIYYIFVFFISAVLVHAQPSQPLSIGPSSSGYVTRYGSGDTLWVENSCALGVMIPHATSDEWLAFASNSVACMNVVECDSTQECCDATGSYITGWLNEWSGSWSCSGSCYRDRDRKYCDGSSETGTWETYTEQAPVGQRCHDAAFTSSGYCSIGSWSGSGNYAGSTSSSGTRYYCRLTRPRYMCGSGGSCNNHVNTQTANAGTDDWYVVTAGTYTGSQSTVACSCHTQSGCWLGTWQGCVYACDGSGGWTKGGCCTCAGACFGGQDFPRCQFSCSTS